MMVHVEVQAPPVPEPVTVLVTFWLGQENGGPRLVHAVGSGGRAGSSDADDTDPLLTHVEVQEPPVPVPVKVKLVALGLGHEKGGKTLVKTSVCVCVAEVMLEVMVADAIWDCVEVHAPPPLPAVPANFVLVLVFGLGQENGGNTLVMTVTSAGLVKVTFDGLEPSLTSVDVHVLPPVPVPTIMVVVFCADGHGNGGNTLVITVGSATVKVTFAVREPLL